jgi:hypothetical protein
MVTRVWRIHTAGLRFHGKLGPLVIACSPRCDAKHQPKKFDSERARPSLHFLLVTRASMPDADADHSGACFACKVIDVPSLPTISSSLTASPTCCAEASSLRVHTRGRVAGVERRATRACRADIARGR